MAAGRWTGSGAVRDTGAGGMRELRIVDCGLRIRTGGPLASRPSSLQSAIRNPQSAIGDRSMSILVVLHEPQDLVNIAHVVRALKNFGFRDLRLVRPREFDAYRIEGIAHQTQDLLARIGRYEQLDEALADCVHVVGFTARERSAKRNRQRPRQAAAELVAQAETGAVALLFGREDKGLPNDALDRCHRLVTIPTDPAYASLQLGHAVVLMLYELALARGAEARPFKAPRREAPPARVEDLERLLAGVAPAARG